MITTIGEVIQQGEIELATMKRQSAVDGDGSTRPIHSRIGLRLALEELQGAVNAGILATDQKVDSSTLPLCLQLLVADNTLTDANRSALGEAVRMLTQRLVSKETPAK